MAQAGLKQLVFCDKGTLSGTPGNAITVGDRLEASHAITPFRTVTEYRGGKLPNMRNHKMEAESLQPTMKMVEILTGFTDLNCDMQFVTTPQRSTSPKHDTFIYNTNTTRLGLDYELKISDEKRSMKIIAEGALSETDSLNLVDAADSTEPFAISGLPNMEGIDFTQYRRYNMLATEVPKSVPLMPVRDVDAFELMMKTVGQKSKIYNYTIVDYIEFIIKISTRKASVSKMVEIANKGISPSLLTKQGNNNAYFDAFDFAAGVLIQSDEYENKDDSRLITLEFSRKVPKYDLTFETGVAAGGASDDKGLNGGTCKIGH